MQMNQFQVMATKKHIGLKMQKKIVAKVTSTTLAFHVLQADVRSLPKHFTSIGFVQVLTQYSHIPSEDNN